MKMTIDEEKLQKAADAMQELRKQCDVALQKVTESFDKFAKAIGYTDKAWYEMELKNIKHNRSLNWFQRSARIRQLKRVAKQNGIDLN
jgi:hypothetical protein